MPGLGASVQGAQSGGSDAYFPAVEFELWGDFGPPTCGVWSGDVFVDFTPLGGGRWMETEIAALPGATTLSVDGIDSVVLSPTNFDKIRVDAFDGPNWVTIYLSHASNAGVLAQAIVTALDTTAVE